MAERHTEILLNNNNTRPIGIKKISEANYDKVNGGKNSNAKGTARALVVAMHAAVGDERVVLWGVEALSKYGE